jgi:hypothetical protein
MTTLRTNYRFTTHELRFSEGTWEERGIHLRRYRSLVSMVEWMSGKMTEPDNRWARYLPVVEIHTESQFLEVVGEKKSLGPLYFEDFPLQEDLFYSWGYKLPLRIVGFQESDPEVKRWFNTHLDFLSGDVTWKAHDVLSLWKDALSMVGKEKMMTGNMDFLRLKQDLQRSDPREAEIQFTEQQILRSLGVPRELFKRVSSQPEGVHFPAPTKYLRKIRHNPYPEALDQLRSQWPKGIDWVAPQVEEGRQYIQGILADGWVVRIQHHKEGTPINWWARLVAAPEDRDCEGYRKALPPRVGTTPVNAVEYAFKELRLSAQADQSLQKVLGNMSS